MKDIKVNSSLGDYRIIEISDISLYLKERRKISLYITAIICSFILSLAISKSGATIIPQNMSVYGIAFVLILLVWFTLIRIISMSNPFIISLQRGILSMRYRKYLGGTKEVVYNSDLLLSVQPGCFSEKGFTSKIRVFLKSGNNIDIALSEYSDADDATEESISAATIFSKILGIKLNPYLFEECALTSNSS